MMNFLNFLRRNCQKFHAKILTFGALCCIIYMVNYLEEVPRIIRIVISDADGTLVTNSKLIDARAFSRMLTALGSRNIPMCIARAEPIRHCGGCLPHMRTSCCTYRSTVPASSQTTRCSADSRLVYRRLQTVCGFCATAVSAESSYAHTRPPISLPRTLH